MMRATSAAPVAIALASSAIAALPAASHSPIMPEPTTAIRRKAVPRASAAACRTTACLLRSFRFYPAHKSAHELFIDLLRDRIHVNARRRKKLTGVRDPIDSRGLDLSLLKPGCGQLASLFIFFHSSRDA